MSLKRFLLVFLSSIVAIAMGLADASAKKPKSTDWDDDAEKELPPLELHGYFRFRGDLFHNFDLGYTDKVPFQFGKLTSFFTPYSERNPNRDILPATGSASNVGADTQSFASMRFRLEPTINVTEDVRIKAQIDIFDNMVLGSTPEGFPNPSGFAPIMAFTPGAAVPSAGINSLNDSIRVKRAWGEVMTPFGLLSFGRMGSNWGMGLLANDGNCMDCDYGDTWDRVIFVTKVKGFYIAPFMDFASEGLISDIDQLAQVYRRGSVGLGSVPIIDRTRPFDLDQRDDVNQYGIAIVKRDSPKEIKEKLENGETVINGGIYALFRNQGWTTENRAYALTSGSFAGSPFQNRFDTPDIARSPLFERRGAKAWIIDPWFKLMRKKMVLEFEAAIILGSIDESVNGQALDVRQFGAVLRYSDKFLNDALQFSFEAGIASGADGSGLGIRDTVIVAPTRSGNQTAAATNFKFDPDFLVDRILFRQIIGAITDAWYLKPTIQYNVTEGFGFKLSFIYSNAVNSKQWPGSTASGNNPGCTSCPIGFETNFDIFYKSEDFLYASLGWGGLVPLAALKDPSTLVDPSFAQTIYTRLIIRY
jgi:uncharacterized protein (TIGR04551 family)